ncbi:COX15/CtaA family protein [Natronosalvus halobius]|uniref:COX15/CtaA family protein n=1 Tax=Natronosalvus halobius TaxID=2953746 RepID=UPI00209EBFE7|nr:COX15/CtaA family protein [Natronosalvus halobius]USZ72606.1 cytochrome oxidase assembly protein [Natronosalvus halobius]
MSYETHTSDSSRLPIDLGRRRFSALLTVTVALVAGTIVLGVATRTTGSGLACDANWPVCDGGFLNLLPQGRPSFWEWIHRVVAMVAGFAIVASALVGYFDEAVDRRITSLVVAGALLTPIQVLLGRETVLTYEYEILNLHFWTAIVIFVCFVLALVIALHHRLSGRHLVAALVVAALTVPVQVILSPLFISQNTPTTLTIQMVLLLTLVGAVVLATVVGRAVLEGRLPRAAIGAGVVLTATTLFLSRESVMTVSSALDLLYVLAAGALIVTLLVGAWASRSELQSGRSGASRSD